VLSRVDNVRVPDVRNDERQVADSSTSSAGGLLGSNKGATAHGGAPNDDEEVGKLEPHDAGLVATSIVAPVDASVDAPCASAALEAGVRCRGMFGSLVAG